jgi:cellobiose transport system substrate-binding protein
VTTALTRRQLLTGAAALGLSTAMAGLLSGCSSGSSISTDPDQLVLWYWSRGVNTKLLQRASRSIPGSPHMSIRGDNVGATNYDTKFRTSLAGHAYIPDIASVNSNCSLYFPDEQLFVDLNDHGASKVKSRYYDWKWTLGTSPTGRQVFWPMDTGPTGFFYRNDVFGKAGLPTDPTELTAGIRTWDDWIRAGQQLKKRTNAAMIMNAPTVFTQYIGASKVRYFDKDDQPLFEHDDGTVKQAWDTAVRAAKAGVTGNLQTTTDQNAGWVSGKVAGHIEGAWWTQVLHDTAPATKGKWRIARQPERPGSSGGSFLCVPSTCKDPDAAVDFISWLTDPTNQAASYNDIQLFPSTPASFTDGTMTYGQRFFGDQDPLDFFGKVAPDVPVSYVSTYESHVTAFTTEMTNVEAGGKDPDRAWRDAVDETNRELEKQGVAA